MTTPVRRRIIVEKLNLVNPLIKHIGQGKFRVALHGYCRFNHIAYGAVMVTSQDNPMITMLRCKRLKGSRNFADSFEFEGLEVGKYRYQAGMFLLDKEEHLYDSESDYLDFDEAFETEFEMLDDSVATYRFGVGSCRFFLNIGGVSFLEHRSDKCYRSMARMNRIQAFMMLGDSVYMDIVKTIPCIRILDSKNFHRIHRLGMSTDGFKDLTSRIPYYSVPDDHEYRDDANPYHKEIEPFVYRDAMDSINTYLNFHGPLSKGSDVPLWAQFEQAGIPFFMADTRYERREFDGKIMSTRQMNALKRALMEPRELNIPFFILSASPFALQPDNSDTWAGYRRDLESLVKFIQRRRIRNVFVLSGDAHCSVSTRYKIHDLIQSDDDSPPTEKYNDIDIVEIMSSGLYHFGISRDKPEHFHVTHRLNNHVLRSTETEDELRSRLIREDNYSEVKVDKVRCEVKVTVRSSSGNKLRIWRYPLST